MNVDAILDGLEAEIVGGAVGHSAADAPAGQESGEGRRIVVSTAAQLFEARVLNHRRAAKLAGDDDERVIEQAARL